MFAILTAGNTLSREYTLPAAIEAAESLLAALPAGERATFTIKDAAGQRVASVTNRRITCSFVKQTWGGRKGDDAIFVGEEHFDATDAVLSLDYAKFLELADADDSSDELGRAHIDWDGPCSVTLLESVCEYFDVEYPHQVTPLEFSVAQAHASPKAAESKMLTLTVQVRVRVAPGASVEDFLADLDYTVRSNTPGVVVTDTEITDSEEN